MLDHTQLHHWLSVQRMDLACQSRDHTRDIWRGHMGSKDSQEQLLLASSVCVLRQWIQSSNSKYSPCFQIREVNPSFNLVKLQLTVGHWSPPLGCFLDQSHGEALFGISGALVPGSETQQLTACNRIPLISLASLTPLVMMLLILSRYVVQVNTVTWAEPLPLWVCFKGSSVYLHTTSYHVC